jgi:CRP/FNR family transcriptional regulator, cyclic AMP receptor protein
MAVSKILSIVSKNPVFASVSKEEIEAILATGLTRAYPAGSLITIAGEVWPYLFLVVEGKISALKESREGRTLMITTFGAGDIFWGLAFFHENEVMPVNLEVTESAQIHLWNRERFLPFLLKNGQISWELSKLMVSRMLRASDIVEGLAFQPVAGRVARFLLEKTPADQKATPRHLTLDEMAAHIGTTREMVCRYLHSFSDEGMINITRTEYFITDRQGLEELSRQAKG